MSVTLREVLGAARARSALLPAEVSGYVALAVAEQNAVSQRAVTPSDVQLGPDGALRVTGGEGTDADGAEASVRGLLNELLMESSSVSGAMLRIANRRMSTGMDALVREVEASLIPVNRGAGRRALSRLYRDTARAKENGALDMPVEAEPRDVPVAVVSMEPASAPLPLPVAEVRSSVPLQAEPLPGPEEPAPHSPEPSPQPESPQFASPLQLPVRLESSAASATRDPDWSDPVWEEVADEACLEISDLMEDETTCVSAPVQEGAPDWDESVEVVFSPVPTEVRDVPEEAADFAIPDLELPQSASPLPSSEYTAPETVVALRGSEPSIGHSAPGGTLQLPESAPPLAVDGRLLGGAGATPVAPLSQPAPTEVAEPVSEPDANNATPTLFHEAQDATERVPMVMERSPLPPEAEATVDLADPSHDPPSQVPEEASADVSVPVPAVEVTEPLPPAIESAPPEVSEPPPTAVVGDSAQLELSEEPAEAELSEDPVAAELCEEPAAAEPCEDPAVAELCEAVEAERSEDPAVAEPCEEPAEAELCEDPVAAELSEDPVAAELCEEPAAAEPCEDPAVAELCEAAEAELSEDPVVAEPFEEAPTCLAPPVAEIATAPSTEDEDPEALAEPRALIDAPDVANDAPVVDESAAPVEAAPKGEEFTAEDAAAAEESAAMVAPDVANDAPIADRSAASDDGVPDEDVAAAAEESESATDANHSESGDSEPAECSAEAPQEAAPAAEQVEASEVEDEEEPQSGPRVSSFHREMTPLPPMVEPASSRVVAPQSCVDDLLENFSVANIGETSDLCRGLKELAGIEATGAPPAVAEDCTPPPVAVAERVEEGDDAEAPGRPGPLVGALALLVAIGVAGSSALPTKPVPRLRTAAAALASDALEYSQVLDEEASCDAEVVVRDVPRGATVTARGGPELTTVHASRVSKGRAVFSRLPCGEALEVTVQNVRHRRWLTIPVTAARLSPRPGAGGRVRVTLIAR